MTPDPYGDDHSQSESSRERPVALTVDSDDTSMSHHAVSGVFWSVIQSWGGRVISTVVFVIIGRLLTPAEFGLVSLGSIIIDLGALLTVSGLHRAIVQRQNLEQEHLNAAFWSSLLIGSVLMAVALLAAPAIASALDQPAFAPLLRVLSVTFLITAVAAVPSAILHRRMAFRAFAIRQLSATVVGGTVGVALAFAGAGAWALVGQSVASAVTGATVVMVSARWVPRRQFSKRHWREMAGFGTASLVIDMFDLANSRVDDLLIGIVLGASALGYYGVAYRTYAIALEVVAYSMSAVAFPILSRIVGDRERAGRGVIAGTRFSACFTLPVFLLLALIGDRALLGLFGEKWGPSVAVLRILCVAAAGTSLVLMSRDLVLAAGRPRLELRKMTLISIATVVAFVIGVQWGLNGVAWSRLAAAAVIVPIGVYGMRQVIDLDLRAWIAACLRPLPACAFMGVVVVALDVLVDAPVTSIPWLLAYSIVGAVSYSIGLWVTARSTVVELLHRVRHRGEPVAV